MSNYNLGELVAMRIKVKQDKEQNSSDGNKVLEFNRRIVERLKYPAVARGIFNDNKVYHNKPVGACFGPPCPF